MAKATARKSSHNNADEDGYDAVVGIATICTPMQMKAAKTLGSTADDTDNSEADDSDTVIAADDVDEDDELTDDADDGSTDAHTPHTQR